MPYGVVGFHAEALGVQDAEESLNLSLPLFRSNGTFGSPEVLIAFNDNFSDNLISIFMYRYSLV